MSWLREGWAGVSLLVGGHQEPPLTLPYHLGRREHNHLHGKVPKLVNSITVFLSDVQTRENYFKPHPSGQLQTPPTRVRQTAKKNKVRD